MSTVGSLLIEMGANLAQLRKDMGSAVGVVEKGMDGIRRAAGAAKQAVGAVTGVLALNEFRQGVANLIDYGDGLRDMARGIGSTVEQLDFLNYAAKASGTDLGTLSGAVSRLQRNLQDVASGGGKKAGDALRRLALDAKVLSNQSLTQQIKNIGTALTSIANPAERSGIAMRLFGASYQNVASLLSEGEGLDKLADNFVRLNASLTSDDGDKFDAFDDSLLDLQTAASGAGQTIARELAPAFTSLFNTTSDVFSQFPGFFEDSMFAIRDFTFGVQIALQKLEVSAQKIKAFSGRILGGEDYSKRVSNAESLLAQLEVQRKLMQEQRDAAIISRAEEQRALRAKLDARPAGAGDISDFEGSEALKKREAAAKKLQDQIEKELKADTRAVRAYLQDIAREREADATRTVEQVRREMDQLREAVKTPLEKELDKLKLYNERFGPNSQEYGRAAIESFNALHAGAETVSVEIQNMRDAAAEFGFTMTSAFEDAIVQGKSFGDLLRGIADDILRIMAHTFVTNPLTKIVEGWADGIGKKKEGSTKSGSGLLSALFDWLPGFATGGSFTVGGAGGVDSQLVAFRATPGENVTVGNGGAGVIVNLIGAPPNTTVRDRGMAGRSRVVDVMFVDALGRNVQSGALTQAGLAPQLTNR